MPASRLDLEIAASGAADARAAVAAGADRVELSTALELGGLTPSAGLIETVVATGAETHVLVRCRPGSFVFDAAEVEAMERDAVLAVEAGARGVVLGALTDGGDLDLDALRRWTDAVRARRADTAVILHRAIDHAADPLSALASSAPLRFDRVLSSGGASAARDGIPMLRRMAALPDGPRVMAGAGVAAGDIRALAGTGIAAVHLSAKRRLPHPGRPGPSLGADGGLDRWVVDPEVVRAVRRAIDAAAAPTSAPGDRPVTGFETALSTVTDEPRPI